MPTNSACTSARSRLGMAFKTLCMDYGLHDCIIPTTSWQSKQAMVVKMSFLTTDHQEPDLGGFSLQAWLRTRTRCCCVVLLPMAPAVALRRRKDTTLPRS